MEITGRANIAWLDESHPNYERWKRARDISFERGKFVRSVIEHKIKCENLTILDLGSGQGGTAKVLSEKNNVLSLDLNIVRLKNQLVPKGLAPLGLTTFGEDHRKNIFRVNGNALRVPLKPLSFDLIILQDVIEHISEPERLINSLHGLLKKNGILYLSTPNKFSIINIISDPHWGFPIISLLKRETIKNYFLKYFRKSEAGRSDSAELFSLNELLRIFKNKFRYSLYTNYSTEELLSGNKGIIWSDFHLALLKIIKLLKFDQLILGLANDKPGITNKYFNPAFYFLLEKI